MDLDAAAKKSAIYDLLDSYRRGNEVPGTAIDAMVAGVASYPLKSVLAACMNFRDGAVPGRNPGYLPEAPEFIAEVRRLDAMTIAPPPLQGITEVDLGRGRIRTGHLTAAEVDYVLDRKGVLPDGRAMSSLPADELKAEVAVALRALPPPAPKSPADIVPHLKRFADA